MIKMAKNNSQSSKTFKDCVCPYVRNKINEVHKDAIGHPCEVPLSKVCKDIIHNLVKKEVKIIFFVSIIIGLIMAFCNSLCLECIRELFNSVLPSLLGFSITVYAILFGINDTVRNKLQQKASDGKIPIEVLHSTFVLGIIIQGFTLIIYILSYTKTQFICPQIAGGLSCFMLSFIILWTINTVLHLYTLRTF